MDILLFVFRFIVLLVVLGYLGYRIWRRYGAPRFSLGAPKLSLGLQKEPQLKICPQLGLSGDPFENAGRPDDDHRCYANLARERIDRGHQQMFCLSASYKRCPFLAVAPRQDGTLDRARAWWRTVSPGRPALAISQPGLRPWLGALAAMWKSRSMPSMPSVPRVQAPAVAALLKKRPAAESPLMSTLMAEPAIDEPVLHESVFEMPLLDERVVDDLVADEPILPGPVADAPVVEFQPVIDEPLIDHDPAWMLHTPALDEPAPMETTPLWLQPEDEPVAAVAPTPVKIVVGEDAELVTAGIAALEIGNELEAQKLFERATQVDKHDVRAWYWRAKTAETLEEVVDCLQQANQLDPSNMQIAENLVNALERLDALHNAPKSRPMANDRTPVTEPEAVPAHLRGPRQVPLAVRLVGSLLAAAAACVAFLISAVWLLSALPSELLPSIPGASMLMDLGMPRGDRLAGMVHMTVAGGYDLGSALPFGIGFLALFVGMGLLNRERWTAIWAPVVVLITFWQIAG